jgi:uncharacterized membrane protein
MLFVEVGSLCPMTFNFFLRWIHIISGITWIGHLYFFNFVNANFQAVLEKELKPKVNPQLMHRALFWFRWGAMFTFLAGLTLFFTKYIGGNLWADDAGKLTQRSMWILFGMLLGTIMWFNVWFIIWPAQKLILGALKAGQAPDAAIVARAGKFSRINTWLSGPMLFGMIAPANYTIMDGPVFIACIVFSLAVIWTLFKVAPKVGRPENYA